MAELRDRNGEAHELPKMTVKVREDFRAALSPQLGDREQATATLKLLRQLLPEDYVSKRCGGKTVDSVDVVELAILAEDVWNAYQEPLKKARQERQLAEYEAVQPIIEEVKQMSEALEKQSKSSRQGFSRVV